jgi:hypothetical protein
MMRLTNFFILLLLLTAACQAQPISPLPDEAELPAEAQAACPGLDSRLWQLTRAAAPLELAQQWQLQVKDDKIQVLLILAGEDTTFLKNFEVVEPGTQSGTKIQVFAPVHQLCALANRPEVVAVRPPTPLFSQ